MLDFLRLEVVVVLASAVGIITQVLRAIPVSFTTDYKKTIAWVVSAVLVGAIGYYEKADVSTIITVTTATALVSHGLYDIVEGYIKNLKALLAELRK